jgi:hypothetical protein
MTVSGKPVPRFSCETFVVAVRVGEGGPGGNGGRPTEEAFERVSVRRLREVDDIGGAARTTEETRIRVRILYSDQPNVPR